MAGERSQQRRLHTRLAAGTAVAVALISAPAAPAGAAAASPTIPGMKITVPASARVSGTTSSGTTSTPANGAQPGTIAPGSTTPTATTPAATTPPSSTTPAPGARTTAPSGPAAAAPATTVPGLPTTLGAAQRKLHKPSKRLSGLALVLAAVGALLALACLVWAAVRWLALEPRWATAMMYSLREATYHASATWTEFSDWARLGR